MLQLKYSLFHDFDIVAIVLAFNLNSNVFSSTGSFFSYDIIFKLMYYSSDQPVNIALHIRFYAKKFHKNIKMGNEFIFKCLKSKNLAHRFRIL